MSFDRSIAGLRRITACGLFALLHNCSADTPRAEDSKGANVAVQQRRSPIADSIRARRAAALRNRPDTLGMRADSGRVLGSASAKVWVVVMSDFQCHSCRDFARNALTQFRRDFVDKGLARLAYVNAPQDQHFNARFAAAAALCAATGGRFWEMHDSLFAQQAVWERMPDPRQYFESLAGAAGVPASMHNDCVSRNRMLLRLSSDIEQSRNAGVTDVPAVFVADRRLGRDELTYEGLADAVKKALAEAR
jgi:protein-disulfide isomerase